MRFLRAGRHNRVYRRPGAIGLYRAYPLAGADAHETDAGDAASIEKAIPGAISTEVDDGISGAAEHVALSTTAIETDQPDSGVQAKRVGATEAVETDQAELPASRKQVAGGTAVEFDAADEGEGELDGVPFSQTGSETDRGDAATPEKRAASLIAHEADSAVGGITAKAGMPPAAIEIDIADASVHEKQLTTSSAQELDIAEADRAALTKPLIVMRRSYCRTVAIRQYVRNRS